MKFKCDECKNLVDQKDVVITADESPAGALGFFHQKCWEKRQKVGKDWSW